MAPPTREEAAKYQKILPQSKKESILEEHQIVVKHLDQSGQVIVEHVEANLVGESEVPKLGDKLTSVEPTREPEVTQIGEKLTSVEPTREPEVTQMGEKLTSVEPTREPEVTQIGEKLTSVEPTREPEVTKLGENLTAPEPGRESARSKTSEFFCSVNSEDKVKSSRIVSQGPIAIESRSAVTTENLEEKLEFGRVEEKKRDRSVLNNLTYSKGIPETVLKSQVSDKKNPGNASAYFKDSIQPEFKVPSVPSSTNILVSAAAGTDKEQPDDESEQVSAEPWILPHLQSKKSWEELNLSEDLLRAVYDKGFMRPSEIQERGIPLVLSSGVDLVAQAQNGSGKTATFALCLLSKVNRDLHECQGVCISPSRELAQQTVEILKTLGKFTNITMWLCVTQSSSYFDAARSQIVVGTPGKLKEVTRKRILKLNFVRLLVLDEADLLFDHTSNLGATIQDIRESTRRQSSGLQTLLFSATYPDRVKRFIERHLRNANHIEVSKEKLNLPVISQWYMECPGGDSSKLSVLSDLYSSMVIGQSIIFVNSKMLCFELAKRMEAEGHAVSLICGNTNPDAMESKKMTPKIRDKIMSEFRCGHTKVLISTDLLARGIDIPQVTLVINYDLPLDYSKTQVVGFETYMHRIGRTGRFGLKGIAISLIEPNQIHVVRQIESFFRCKINKLEADTEAIERMVSELRIS